MGALDLMVPPRYGRELVARIPRAELVEIAAAGHLHMIEQPEAFNEAVLGVLARHGRA